MLTDIVLVSLQCVFSEWLLYRIYNMSALSWRREWLLLFHHRKWPCADQWWPQVGLCQLCGFGWELDTGHDVQVLHRSTSSKVDHTMQITLVMKENWWFCFYIIIIFYISAHICSDQSQCIATNSCVMTYWFFGHRWLFIPYLFQKKG